MPILSQKKTLQMTSTPAIAPMMNAPTGVTNAHGAVMATRPASMLLHIIEGSGLPNDDPHVEQPVSVAAMPREHGVDGDDADAAVGAGQREPALKPNQPKARMNVPSMTIGMWWPRIGVELAVLVVLADARADAASR